MLTAYGGGAIAYEGQTYNADGTVTGSAVSGNPTSYYNGARWSFDWEKGRQLASASSGTQSLTYTYDMAGVRSSKTVNGVTHNYTTLSGRVMRETWGSESLDFIYDENDQPFAVRYNGATYYYILNVQGDVVGLMDGSRNVVAEYRYDPWGRIVSESGTSDIASKNPLRYRGYYYDTETGMYYLQSRYYNPEIGRFVNEDSYATTGIKNLFGANMFAYCGNNPVNRADPTGHWFGEDVWNYICDTWDTAVEWVENNVGFASYTVSPGVTLVDVVFCGAEENVSLELANGNANKPLVFYCQKPTKWYRISEYGIGIKVTSATNSLSVCAVPSGGYLSYQNNKDFYQVSVNNFKTGIAIGHSEEMPRGANSISTQYYVRPVAFQAAYVFCSVTGAAGAAAAAEILLTK